MIGPPTNSPSVNCQPRISAIAIPSSITRFVEAIWNAIAAVKSAPFRKSERASATAAYEHEDDAAPNPAAFSERPRRVVGERPLDGPLRDERLHDRREQEPEDERPEDLPRHPEAQLERLPELVADRDAEQHYYGTAIRRAAASSSSTCWSSGVCGAAR